MATKSILKTVNIKNSRAAARLARALESTSKSTVKPIKMSRPVSNATSEDIRKMFGL